MTTETFELVPARDLLANPENLRTDVGDVTDLAASIASRGIVQPLRAFRNEDGKLVLIAGHRRLAAVKTLNGKAPKVLPVVVTDRADDADVTADMLVENLQRADLHPLDEAVGFAKLIASGQKQADVAKTVGISASVVSRRLALLKLSDEVQALLRDGTIDLDLAEALVALRDDEVRTAKVLERLAADGRVQAWFVQQQVDDAVRDKVRTKAERLIEQAGLRLVDNWGAFEDDEHGVVEWQVNEVEAPDEDGEVVLGHEEIEVTPLNVADVAGRPLPEGAFAWGVRMWITGTRSGSPKALADVYHLIPSERTPASTVDDADPEAEAKRKAAEKEERAKRKEREAAELERLQAIIAAKHSRADLVTMVLPLLVPSSAGTAQHVCNLLGLDPVTTEDGKRKDWHATIAAALEERTKPAEQDRLLLAMLIADSGWRQQVKDYLAQFEVA